MPPIPSPEPAATPHFVARLVPLDPGFYAFSLAAETVWREPGVGLALPAVQLCAAPRQDGAIEITDSFGRTGSWLAFDQPGDSLVQKLRHLVFTLDEEDSVTIASVAGRARAAFDLDRVTKRFYDRFQVAMEPTEQQQILVDALTLANEDLPVIPTYIYMTSVMFRKGVVGPGTVSPNQLASAWNVHTWQID